MDEYGFLFQCGWLTRGIYNELEFTLNYIRECLFQISLSSVNFFFEIVHNVQLDSK